MTPDKPLSSDELVAEILRRQGLDEVRATGTAKRIVAAIRPTIERKMLREIRDTQFRSDPIGWNGPSPEWVEAFAAEKGLNLTSQEKE